MHTLVTTCTGRLRRTHPRLDYHHTRPPPVLYNAVYSRSSLHSTRLIPSSLGRECTTHTHTRTRTLLHTAIDAPCTLHAASPFPMRALGWTLAEHITPSRRTTLKRGRSETRRQRAPTRVFITSIPDHGSGLTRACMRRGTNPSSLGRQAQETPSDTLVLSLLHETLHHHSPLPTPPNLSAPRVLGHESITYARPSAAHARPTRHCACTPRARPHAFYNAAVSVPAAPLHSTPRALTLRTHAHMRDDSPISHREQHTPSPQADLSDASTSTPLPSPSPSLPPKQKTQNANPKKTKTQKKRMEARRKKKKKNAPTAFHLSSLLLRPLESQGT
ncbi:hypothetical protein B0H19DRAFT_1383667 [Mycena capillaripes]|nr:hypothetical protein B0H19DRAFT_1383667 [Mycena capillaripes]